MRQVHGITALLGCAGLMIAAGHAPGQTLDAVVVQGQPTPAIYDFHFDGPPGNQFAISAIAFPSGNLLPPAIINAIQWTDPLVPPPNVDPQIYFYQFQDPLGTLNVPQLQIGNLFGAMGFIDGVIDLQQPPGQATFDVPPNVPPGNVPNDPIQRAGALGGPPPFQDTIIYHDPQPVPDGLNNTILVGLALPGTTTTTRGMVTFGQADPQTEPTDPNAAGGNGEYVWVPAPAVPDPCIDESLITQATLDFLNAEEAANGVNITSETEVVNGVTVRDKITSFTEASDGFTYVTVVEDFVTTQFYRFPTGTVDPKGNVPPPVLLGDANKDGQVTGADLISVQQNFGNVGQPPLQGDANNDGQVTGADLISVQQNFGNVLAPVSAHVPEPAMVILVLAGVCAGSLRRPCLA